MTHLQEVLSLHDLSVDKNAGGIDTFKTTCINNFHNREMHHHVFDLKLIHRIFKFLRIEILQSDTTFSDNIVLGKIPHDYKINKNLSKAFIAKS